MRIAPIAACFVFLGLSFSDAGLMARDPGHHTESPSETAQTPDPPTAAQDQPRLEIGLGWPDLRLRYNLWGPLDVEAKVAAAQGEIAYAGRLYWRACSLGPVTLVLGGEGGGLNYSAIDSLHGDGSYYGPFAGLQYRFVRQWALLVDYGPAWIHVNAQGGGITEQQWILNTALYFTVF